VQYSAWAEPTSEAATRATRPNTRQRPDRFHACILQPRAAHCSIWRHSAWEACRSRPFSRLRNIRPLLLRPRFCVAPVPRRARGATPPPEQLKLSAASPPTPFLLSSGFRQRMVPPAAPLACLLSGFCCCLTTQATPHTPKALSTRSTRDHLESCVCMGAGWAVEEASQSTRPVLTEDSSHTQPATSRARTTRPANSAFPAPPSLLAGLAEGGERILVSATLLLLRTLRGAGSRQQGSNTAAHAGEMQGASRSQPPSLCLSHSLSLPPSLAPSSQSRLKQKTRTRATKSCQGPRPAPRPPCPRTRLKAPPPTPYPQSAPPYNTFC
jgi:hypothetical protein